MLPGRRRIFDGYPAILVRLDRIALEALEEVVVEVLAAHPAAHPSPA
jgi:hypothetical protein